VQGIKNGLIVLVVRGRKCEVLKTKEWVAMDDVHSAYIAKLTFSAPSE
jgi:hypothetical protein